MIWGLPWQDWVITTTGVVGILTNWIAARDPATSFPEIASTPKAVFLGLNAVAFWTLGLPLSAGIMVTLSVQWAWIAANRRTEEIEFYE